MPPRRVGRARQNEGIPGNVPRGNGVEGGMPPQERRVEELFLKQNPPTFNGLGDPAIAETWVRALERIFNFLQCNDRERLTCVTFQLVESADFWWEARRKTMTPEQLAHMTWEEFKTGLYDKYIPKSYRKAKEVEFYNLKQGQMTVNEYDRMFCDMSRYAPGQVDTDEKMAEKFCAGLRHEIRMALASHGGLSYLESLSRALDIEAAMPREKSTVPVAAAPSPQQQQNFRVKRKRHGDQTPDEDKKQQTAKNHPQDGGREAAPDQRGEYRTKAPLCAMCFRNHFGECKAGTDGCYRCGMSGHFSKECPNKNVGAGMGARQNYQGPRLQALQAEPRGDPAPPPQQQQPHHGYVETVWELEDKAEEN